jgi:hypothetical protein
LNIPKTVGPLPDIMLPTAPVFIRRFLISAIIGKAAMVTASRSFDKKEAI